MKYALVLQSGTILRKRLIPAAVVFIALPLPGYAGSPAQAAPAWLFSRWPGWSPRLDGLLCVPDGLGPSC
jgi:hypothetical protein